MRDEASGRWNELQKAESQRQVQLADQARQEEARRQTLWQELAALSREASSLEGSVGAAGTPPGCGRRRWAWGSRGRGPSP